MSKPTELYSPIPIGSVATWDDETDVIVIGIGAAGVCAAIEARESEIDVLAIERASGISGTTCAAGGVVYLGGGTRPQRANGIEDTTDEMFKYLMANTPEPDEEKLRLYCDESVSHFDWLLAHGVPFNDGFWQTKHHEPPSTDCLSWSGNEKAWPISESARPAPRGHKVEHPGGEGGGLLVRRLVACAEELGVRFQYDANVTNLVVDANGSTAGVRYSHFGEERFVRARAGVVLAAGGFAMNPAMLEEYCPDLAQKDVMKQGNPNDDGAGIKMGAEMGGNMIHMDGALITAPFYPPPNLIKGILVNETGRRFINEDCYHARTSDAAIHQPNGTVYLICDDINFGRPELGMQRLIDAWETIEEMERDLGLPRKSLQDEVTRYNAFASEGEDRDFHKHADWLAPIATAPFAALECSLGQSYYVGFTLGGLAVSTDAEVLGTHDDPIPGLYAAGACASNIAQDGRGYSSGTCIGEATFFGRRAGRHAAKRLASAI
jgi:3-oxo-5alpha-steroid 4-dehydrogenase